MKLAGTGLSLANAASHWGNRMCFVELSGSPGKGNSAVIRRWDVQVNALGETV